MLDPFTVATEDYRYVLENHPEADSVSPEREHQIEIAAIATDRRL